MKKIKNIKNKQTKILSYNKNLKYEIIKDSFILLLLFILIFVSIIIDDDILSIVSIIQNRFLFYIANLLNERIIITALFVVLIALFLGNSKRWKFIIPVLLSITISFLVCYILKLIFSRPRPNNLIMYFSIANFRLIDYSFPSAHVALTFAALPFIILVAPHLKWLWIFFSVFIAFSRVYIGVHYFSDVIGGAVIGYIIGKYLLIFFRIHHETKNKIKHS